MSHEHLKLSCPPYVVLSEAKELAGPDSRATGCIAAKHPRYPRLVRRQKRFFVYILMNKGGTTLYVGVTDNLLRRIEEHRSGEGSEFVRRYRVFRLVYFEEHFDAREAVLREKTIKGWKREKKEALIRTANPRLADLTDEAAHVIPLELGLG